MKRAGPFPSAHSGARSAEGRPVKRAVLLLALLGAAAAQAGDHGRRTMPLNASYTDECGTCHVAFPPGLLPADSWKRLMGGLPRHFGSDASLEPVVATSLATWLQANAGHRRSEAPPEDRITRTRWFLHEHDEVPAGAWQRASIKSAANCTACHAGAAQGDFDEHAVRIPR